MKTLLAMALALVPLAFGASYAMSCHASHTGGLQRVDLLGSTVSL